MSGNNEQVSLIDEILGRYSPDHFKTACVSCAFDIARIAREKGYGGVAIMVFNCRRYNGDNHITFVPGVTVADIEDSKFNSIEPVSDDGSQVRVFQHRKLASYGRWLGAEKMMAWNVSSNQDLKDVMINMRRMRAIRGIRDAFVGAFNDTFGYF